MMTCLPTLPEQLAQQAVPLGGLAVAGRVEALDDRLRPGHVGDQLRVVGEIELAAPHPLLHVAHGECCTPDVEDCRTRTRT